ncbi:MAG: pilus assembly protein [Patulibacter sp.]|nr:pilus assembly protein [Patulibacter sp.]
MSARSSEPTSADPRAGRPWIGAERGQASVELVALLPLFALILLALVQACLAGYAAWSATTAARAGARAHAVGTDVERAVRAAAPIGGAGARIARDEDAITVRVPVPSVLPIAVGTIAGAARFEAQR